jgi:hypothetical protein
MKDIRQEIFEECLGDGLEVSTNGFSAGFVSPAKSPYASHYYLAKKFLWWHILKYDYLIGTWRQIFRWFGLNNGSDLPEDFICPLCGVGRDDFEEG